MWSAIPEVLPFFKGRPQPQDSNDASLPLRGNSRYVSSRAFPPSLRVTMDRTAYRPGDTIVATINILNEGPPFSNEPAMETSRYGTDAVLLEDLVAGVRGIEKMDPQWLLTPRLPAASKLRKGERTILESPATSLVSNVLVEQGLSKSYQIRTTLPEVLPPSYRGTAVRYIYYLAVKLNWIPAFLDGSRKGSQSIYSPVEVRTIFTMWTLPDKSGLTVDETQSPGHYGLGGIVPSSPVDMEIQWRENHDSSDWAWADDNFIRTEEDENGSQLTDSVTHSPVKGGLDNFDRALSFASPLVTPRGTLSEASVHRLEMSPWKRSYVASSTSLENGQGTMVNHHLTGTPDSRMAFERKSGLWQRGSNSLTASVSSGNFDALLRRSNSTAVTQNGHGSAVGGRGEDDSTIGSPPSPSVVYARGKSYNIRIDDQILVRFSPRNPQSIYYFGDVVSGTLSFFHEEGARRCLQVSVSLETRELLNPAALHPSRKNAPALNKVQSEYSEVVADTLSTNFIFSVPIDGPPSFSTPQLSVQWILRFEFVASAQNVDWSKCESALEVEDRERGEWSMPITVHAPLPRSKVSGAAKERPLSPRKDVWLRSPRAPGRTQESSRLSSPHSSPGRWDGASTSSSRADLTL